MIEPVKKQQTQQMDTASSNVPAASMGKNLDMEAEYVQLPSRGLFYPAPFQGITQLKIRKLNWEDEDILTTRSYYDNGTLFNEILKNCIVDESGFKADLLVDVDKNAILWWLRIGAFGQTYTIPHECANEDCKAKSQVSWDLGSFENPDFNPEYEQEITENGYATITLPVSQLKCCITSPSGGRELEIAKRLKNKKQKTNSTKDFNVTGRLLSIIKKAFTSEGKEVKDLDGVLTWLKTGFNGGPIPIVDSRYIQQIAREIDLKVNTKQDIVCKACDHIEEGVEMPMSIYFFWPEFDKLQGVPTKID